MQRIYSLENKSKTKSFKTSVLVDKNGRFFAKIAEGGVLLEVDKFDDLNDLNMPSNCSSIVLSTSAATIVPEELFDYSQRQAFIEAAGIYPTADEVVEVSTAVDGVVAVMLLNRQLADRLKEFKVPRYHSVQINLIRARDKKLRTGRVLLMNMGEDSLTVTLHTDGKLRLAEVFPIANNDEVLFIVKHIERKFPAVQGVTKIFGLGATQCYEYLTQFVDSIEMDIVDESGVEYNNLILGI